MDINEYFLSKASKGNKLKKFDLLPCLKAWDS